MHFIEIDNQKLQIVRSKPYRYPENPDIWRVERIDSHLLIAEFRDSFDSLRMARLLSDEFLKRLPEKVKEFLDFLEESGYSEP